MKQIRFFDCKSALWQLEHTRPPMRLLMAIFMMFFSCAAIAQTRELKGWTLGTAEAALKGNCTTSMAPRANPIYECMIPDLLRTPESKGLVVRTTRDLSPNVIQQLSWTFSYEGEAEKLAD